MKDQTKEILYIDMDGVLADFIGFKYYDIYFLSVPMWCVPESFTGKRLWLEKYFGDLCKERLILSSRKDLSIGHFLIDDRLKHGVPEFVGHHIHFDTTQYPNWESVLKFLIPKTDGAK